MAERMPSRCSPGTFMKRGRPAPVPMKIFQNPARFRASKVAVLPTRKLVHELAAQLPDLPHHVIDQLVGQTELRNAVTQYAAKFMKGLEYGDRITLLGQQIGVDQAGGAGTHHRDRRFVGLGPGIDEIGHLEEGVRIENLFALGQVPLQLADLDGSLVMGADPLALDLLRDRPGRSRWAGDWTP